MVSSGLLTNLNKARNFGLTLTRLQKFNTSFLHYVNDARDYDQYSSHGGKVVKVAVL